MPFGRSSPTTRGSVTGYCECSPRRIGRRRSARSWSELDRSTRAGARRPSPRISHWHGRFAVGALAQLVAVCNVNTWKLLRRDRGLSRQATELAMVELISPLLEDR